MIDRLTIDVVRMPMRRSFGHAKAVRSVAENVLLTVKIGDFIGIGECVPRDYVTGETVDSVCNALLHVDLHALSDALRFDGFEEGIRAIEGLALPTRLGQNRPAPAAACALELALLDSLCRRFARPLSDVAGALDLPKALAGPGLGSFKVTRVLDFSTDIVAFLAQEAWTHRVKVKVGRDIAGDVDRIRRLRDALGPATPIAVDANMAWTFDEATRAVERLAPLGIAWYEEPLSDNHFAKLRRFRELTGEKVMLDEALSSLDDARRALRDRACDLINIRLSKCGGFIPSLRLAEFAHNNSLDFQIGVQVGEMGPLWAAGRHFAAAVRGAVAYEAGQGDLLFEDAVIDPQPPIDRRTYLAPTLSGPGLGVNLVTATWRYVVRHHAWSGRSNNWIMGKSRVEVA